VLRMSTHSHVLTTSSSPAAPLNVFPAVTQHESPHDPEGHVRWVSGDDVRRRIQFIQKLFELPA